MRVVRHSFYRLGTAQVPHSDPCRQAGLYRARHSVKAAVLDPEARWGEIVYECPRCESRYLGIRRCLRMQYLLRSRWSGPCPHCGEPVAHSDLDG